MRSEILNADDKSELIENVLRAQLGHYVTWSPTQAPPIFGTDYHKGITKLRSEVAAFIAKHRDTLRNQDDVDLQAAYRSDGWTEDDQLKLHWKEVRAQAPVSNWERAIIDAGLGRPDYIADYDYWSCMEWIELEEAVWLSIGLDPRQEWSEKLQYISEKRPADIEALGYAQGLTKQLARFVSTVDPLTKKFKGPELLDWILATNFSAHPEFVKMLQARAVRSERDASSEIGIQTKGRSAKEDPRAVRAVSRIITAIAIEEYGYDPDARRSPIPTEIVAIMDRLGLQATAETVLKYLKIGAKDLPPGWNESGN